MRWWLCALGLLGVCTGFTDNFLLQNFGIQSTFQCFAGSGPGNGPGNGPGPEVHVHIHNSSTGRQDCGSTPVRYTSTLDSGSSYSSTSLTQAFSPLMSS